MPNLEIQIYFLYLLQKHELSIFNKLQIESLHNFHNIVSQSSNLELFLMG